MLPGELLSRLRWPSRGEPVAEEGKARGAAAVVCPHGLFILARRSGR